MNLEYENHIRMVKISSIHIGKVTVRIDNISAIK